LVGRLPDEQRAGLVPALRALTQAVEAAPAGEPAGPHDEDAFDAVRRVGGLVDDPLDPAPDRRPECRE
jgi:hypothetical protein